MASRGRRWSVAFGLAVCLLGPTRADASIITLVLAAGMPGNSTPVSTNQFQYDPGNNNGLVGLNQFTADGTHLAVSGGGNVFFGGASLPLLFNLSDGSAYIASGDLPTDAHKAVVGENTLASAVAESGGALPDGADLLGITVSSSEGSDINTITASIMGSGGNVWGTASVEISNDGWWVLGLSSQANTTPDPEPEEEEPEEEEPEEEEIPTPVPGPAATPEPSTLAMAAFGAGALGWWRKRKQPRA